MKQQQEKQQKQFFFKSLKRFEYFKWNLYLAADDE